MKSIFNDADYDLLVKRLHKLTPESERQWGKMSIGQMLWHCQFPLKIAIENKDHGIKGNPLIRWFFKKSLYNDKPWRKNLPTAPQLKATEEKDFKPEFDVLLSLVKECHAKKKREKWNPHPLFGHFTHEQWGQLEFKHLDHHLKQFGV